MSIKVICIWSPHHPPLHREQFLWCASVNASQCIGFIIVSYYCLPGEFSEVNSEKSFTLKYFEPHIRRRNSKSNAFASHGKSSERFISSSYSCHADLKLWNFRNVWFSPEPSSNQTELKLSTTCFQSNTCWRVWIPLRSGHVRRGLLVLLHTLFMVIHLWMWLWTIAVGLWDLPHLRGGFNMASVSCHILPVYFSYWSCH